MKDAVVIVSGLPRTGTSLMMQMLAAGGIEPLTDGVRAADEDNPRGYFEIERVKRLQQDATWLAEARGKAVKVISQLLFALPPTERYRVLFLERNLDEVLASQARMLARTGRTGGDADKVRAAFVSHLARLEQWLPSQTHLTTLRVNYAEAVAAPQATADRVNAFLGGGLDAQAMVAAVEPALYRNHGVS